MYENDVDDDDDDQDDGDDEQVQQPTIDRTNINRVGIGR